MIGRILAGTAAALLIASSLSAAKPTPAKSADGAESSAKICKMIVPTGTILAKRFCLTKKEWAEFNELNQENADGYLSKRGAGMCGAGKGDPNC